MSVTADVQVLEQAWSKQRSDIRRKALVRNLCLRYERSHRQHLDQLRHQLKTSSVYSEYLSILGEDFNWVEKSC